MSEDRTVYMTPVHQKPCPTGMGVSIDGVDYPSLEHVPGHVFAEPGISFDARAIGAHIRQWECKRANAKTPIHEAMADGVVSGLELACIIHGAGTSGQGGA